MDFTTKWWQIYFSSHILFKNTANIVEMHKSLIESIFRRKQLNQHEIKRLSFLNIAERSTKRVTICERVNINDQ